MTSEEMTMCDGPLREKVMRWIGGADTDRVVAMTGEEAFPGLCLAYLIRGGT